MNELNDLRVVVVAPHRDGDLTCDFLSKAGFNCVACSDEFSLREELADGAAVLLCAEESMNDGIRQEVVRVIESQPPWSDIPILIVASSTDYGNRLASLAHTRSVSVLGRPMAIDSLVTAVQSALRARLRQYEVRDLILERELANRRKDDFLAMLAHELRNPLAPVRYGVQVLRDECESCNERAAHAISLMDRQVAHMARLIEDLLDVSRINRGAVKLQLERIDLRKLAKDVVETRLGIAESKQLQLQLVGRETPLWVNADEIRLTQVLENLIENAEKFSKPCGAIRVGVAMENEEAIIWVEDEGEGIDASNITHLFETFSQVDRSLDRSKGGLGLGLSIVSGILNLHGGRVTAASDGPGKGARFTVYLPWEPSIQQIDLPPNRSGASAIPNQLKVLVVEDNHDAADLLKMLLNLYGHTVEVAHSGPEAIEAAQRFAPDVMLCDIGLPGMSGYAVAQALRLHPAHRPGRLVAVSGYGSPEHRREAMDAGFDAHLVKPVSPEALLGELKQTPSRN